MNITEYSVGDNVYVRNYVSKVKWKPGVVVNKIGRLLMM